LASSADEGRGTLRKARTSRVQAQESEMSEWGNPHAVIGVYSYGRGNRVN